MGWVAVSFCNTTGQGSRVLALLDPATGAFRWLDFDRDDVNGAQGLAQSDRELFAALTIGVDAYVAVFDKRSFGPPRLVALPGLLDLHSICLYEGTLCVVSTGTDEIVRLELPRLAMAGIVWRASTYRSDSQHVNALTSADGHLVCSAFGLNPGTRWSTATNGYVYDITGGKMLQRPINHPHSVLFHQGRLYVCESSAGTLLVDGQRLVRLDGYTRGLAFLDDNRCVVATSVGRHRAEEAAAVLNPLDEGERRGRCALSLFDPGDPGTIDVADLSPHGSEIYDVLPLSVP